MANLAPIAVEPRDEGFVASVPLALLDRLGEKPEVALQTACDAYDRAVGLMRDVLEEIEQCKKQRTRIPARKMWELGDAVVNLGSEMEDGNMEIDSLNDHLVRDLGINAKRMGTFVTFRRHLPNGDVIPDSLGWSQCEKQARKVAEELKAAHAEAG